MANGYRDIVDRIRGGIAEGRLRAGDRVGPVRELAVRFGVSLVTAERALRELAQSGWLNRVARKGFFVSDATACIRGRIHAVLTTLDARTPFVDLLNGILGEVWPRGYPLSISCSERSVETCIEAVRRALLDRVDGVIYMPGGQEQGFAQNRTALQRLVEHGVPVVTVGHCRLPGLNPLPGVSSAHEQGGYALTRHLLEQGARRIAVLGALPNQDEQAIIAGYRRALGEAGVPDRPQWIRCRPIGAALSPEVDHLMHAAERPEAILALSDPHAVEIIAELTRLGLAVPEDIRVVGFGDYAFGGFVTPPLTTMRVNLRAVGSLAAALLIDRIEGRPVPPDHVEVPCQLLVRRSCGALDRRPR